MIGKNIKVYRLCKLAKRAVSKAILRKYSELYERLEIKEERKVYKLTKKRDKQQSRDFNNVWCIKD